MLTSVQFFNALNKYIPSLVLQNWIDQQKAEEEYLEAERRALKSPNKLGEKPRDLSQPVVIARPKQQLPFIQDMETVVLFADISGFTNISEACAKLGIRGNEELAFCINRYMEGMVKNLAKFGGDIIKFVGDAMIVMWPRARSGDDPEGQVDDEKVTVIRKAIQCAYDIQKELNNKKIMANVTNLSVKIGIAYGKCALLYVGGVFDRAEFFTVGSALTHALSSEEQATAGGQIIVSDTAFRYVKSLYYEGEEIISEEKKRFYRVTKVIQGVRGRADAVLLKSQIKHDRMTAIQKSLRSCVPAAIMPYLEIGYEQFGSETRALTIMFASLGVDLSSASSTEGMHKIQRIVTTVQQQVYRLEGSLNKLVMDDKGSTLICIWGACPMAHDDDPARAIFTALNMRKELKKIDNTWCNIGIATGDVFSGVVGTSGSRKEFSVLGDSVNLAARIMFYPLKYGRRGEINCCLRTKNEAMNTFNFKYYDHCEFKGKSISIPIFSPIDPREDLFLKEIKDHTISPLQMLKLHFNPLIVQKDVNHKKMNEPFIGKSGFMGEIYDNIKQYLFGQKFSGTSDSKDPLSMIVAGKSGSGKTHLMKALTEKIHKDTDFVKHQPTMPSIKGKSGHNSSLMGKSSYKFPVFATTNSCDQRFKFLGTWRPILHNMLIHRSRQLEISKQELLKRIVLKHKDKIDILLEIFGAIANEAKFLEQDFAEKQKICKVVVNEVEQVEPITKNNPMWFLLRQKFSHHVTDQLLQIVLDFIKEFTGDDEDQTFESEEEEAESESNPSSRLQMSNPDEFSDVLSKRKKAQSSAKKEKRVNPCILIFDQASMMEEESFSLLLRVFEQCTNLVIFAVVDQDQKGNPVFPKLDQTKPQMDPSRLAELKLYQRFIDCSYNYDMPAVSKKDLKRMLIDLAPRYHATYSEEVRLMTDIKDPAHTIKTVEKSQEWVVHLSRKYQLHAVYRNLDNNIIDVIMQKSQGIIMYCLQFFFNLLSNDYIEINRSLEVVERPSLQRCRLLQNYTKIPVPPFALKKRLRNLDAFLKEGKNSKYKGNIRKQEIHVKGLMILKTAAIIGEEFGTQALKKILPLRNETHSSIQVILKELELAELIEILDETDLKNIHCRFNQSFLRESLYQVMLYRDQKQVLHQQLADYIQSLPSSVMSKEQIEIEIDKLRDHILMGEDVQTEEELPFKQKYGIIVKQMQNILINSTQNVPLYKSFVFKQGKKANKKISKRLLILTSRDLMWYHNTKEWETGQQPLGLIKVENIFKVFETLMQSGTFDFEVAVTQYIRKGILDENVRNIKFGCESENDRNHWISRIEFLKAKLVYDQYVNKFVNIQFPLKKEEDFEEDDSEQKKDAMIEQLHQFGKNFKANARIDHGAINQQIQKINPQALKKPSNMRASVVSQLSIPRALTQDYDSMGNQAQKSKDLAEKLGRLYNASIINVLNHVSCNANKSQNIGITKKLGRMPDYFQPDWLFDSPKKEYLGSDDRSSIGDNKQGNSPSKIMSMAQQQSQRYMNAIQAQADAPSPVRIKSNFNPRNSVLVPDKRQQIQEIKEMDEGSSSNGERMPSSKRGVTRFSEKVKSDKRLKDGGGMKHQDIKVSQLQSNNSTQQKQKSSPNVRDQMSMQEQKKLLEESLKSKRFTLGIHPTQENQLQVESTPNNIKRVSGDSTLTKESKPPAEQRASEEINEQSKIRELKRPNPLDQQMRPHGKSTISSSRFTNQMGPHPIEGISSINEDHTEYGYHTRSVPNEIQQEINAQINLGLKQFFEKLDQKLMQQKQQIYHQAPMLATPIILQPAQPFDGQRSDISMRQLFDSTMFYNQHQIMQQQTLSPETTHKHQQMYNQQAQYPSHQRVNSMMPPVYHQVPISSAHTLQNEFSPVGSHPNIRNQYPGHVSPGDYPSRMMMFDNMHSYGPASQFIPRSANNGKQTNQSDFSSRNSNVDNRKYRKIIESHPQSKASDSSDDEPKDPEAFEATYGKRQKNLKMSHSQKLV